MDLRMKYRPSKFEDFHGNKNSLDTVKQFIKIDGLDPGNITQGDFGTGKTSLQRLTAKSYFCENRSDGQVEPCGYCNSCVSFENSNTNLNHRTGYCFTNYYEVHCPDHEDHEFYKGLFKDIDRGLHFFSSRKRSKVIVLLNEFQRTTQPVREIFLDKFEDYPNVIFLLTISEADADKVKSDIRDRLTLIKMSPLSPEESLEFLKKICSLERIDYDEDGLIELTELARGIPRNLLGYLKPFLGRNKITAEAVGALLDVEGV